MVRGGVKKTFFFTFGQKGGGHDDYDDCYKDEDEDEDDDEDDDDADDEDESK